MITEPTTFTKPEVVVNPRAKTGEILHEVGICLYLPVDSLGTIVPIETAVRLECWQSRAEKRKHLPDVLNCTAVGLSRALLKRPKIATYGTLRMTAAFVSISKLNDWFHTLYRHPEGDVTSFVYSEAELELVGNSKEVGQ